MSTTEARLNKYIYWDSEYSQSTEPKMNVVCASFFSDKTRSFWTNRNKYEVLKLYLESLPPETIFVTFAAEAEASALISIGVDPLRFNWIDLQLEMKMLYNHNQRLMVGKHLKDGREIVIRPKLGKFNSLLLEKPPTNLASCLYRMLNVKIDTDHKTKMRDIIISDNDADIEANAFEIMRYCESDVKYLPALFQKIKEEYRRSLPNSLMSTLEEDMVRRGEFSARTALMVREGLPINMDWARNLAANVPLALIECIKDINDQFPDIMPFRFDKRTGYVMDTKAIRQWIRSSGFDQWPLTDGGVKGKRDFSLALEAWEEFFNFRHDFPRGNFGAQMVRYLKLKQSLASFKFTGDKSFFDTLGSDGRSRPFMNHFGAQSSRSQPKSTGFLFLKAAWMRVLAQPPKGYALGAIDYSSQEFLIGALLSGDTKMLEAYKSGDVYLSYGKEIGVIPQDGTKKTHSAQRDAQKPVILGWLFWSTGYSLSYELTNQTGRKWTPEEAQPLLDRLDSVYSKMAAFRQHTIDKYKAEGRLVLPDNWVMFGDNPKFRSVANFGVQGFGASIMRLAVALAQQNGLKVIQSLHDALYILSPAEKIKEDMDTLRDCMRLAFIEYFNDQQKPDAAMIRMDGKIWGPDLEEGQVVTDKGFKLETSRYHIDPRSKKEYAQFQRFFMDSPGNELI